MSRRSRERKLQKLEAKQKIHDEMKERYRQGIAKTRQRFGRIGIGVAGLIVLALMVWGGVYVYGIFFGSITGPFGSITKAELSTNNIVVIETSEGSMTFELDIKNTPKTSANFVLLAQQDYFNGIKFHRIMKDFMIQTGDPNSKNDDPSDDGTGGPGYQFDDEKIVGEYTRGTLAMANSGANTNGSQFFIMHKDTELPKNYVIFGKLIDGFDVLDEIADTPVEDNGTGEVSRPTEDVIINNVVLSGSTAD